MAEEIKKILPEDSDEREFERDFYRMYLEELKEIPVCTIEEEKVLLEAVLKGDTHAKKRLVEGHLKEAAELAAKYTDKGLPAGDLVQEANVALLLFVEEYSGRDFKPQMEKRIREVLELALDIQDSELQVEEEMLARVNVLKDISAGMAEELDREATVEELAERMKMTEEEIRNIMKLTLDAMSVSGE